MPPEKGREARNPQDLVPEEHRAGKQAPFASEDYNKVARSAKLEALMLTAAKFNLKPQYFRARRTEGAIEYVYNANPTTVVFSQEDGNASCTWNWKIEAKSGKSKLLVIEASYLIIYSNLSGCDDDAVAGFLHRVGRFSTYPYFRAHVSQVSWESSANLPLLPVISS